MILFIIVIIIIGFIIAAVCGKSGVEELIELNDSMKSHYKNKENLEFLVSIYNIDYIAGFKDIGKKNNIGILLFKDRIRIVIENIQRDIFKVDILDCYIQSETQLKQNISIGKIACFGIFALAGNNTKEENKEFMVIECNYEDEKIGIVFDCKDQICLEKSVQDIRRLSKSDFVKDEDFKPYY